MPRGIRRKSARAAATDAADPGHRPIVLVMLATFSLSPATPVRTGNDRNVPPPAIELMAAAANAARMTSDRVQTGEVDGSVSSGESMGRGEIPAGGGKGKRAQAGGGCAAL